jgi:hypothetical protein
MLMSLGLAYLAKYYQQTAMGKGHSAFNKQDILCPKQYHSTQFGARKVGLCERINMGADTMDMKELLQVHLKDYWRSIRKEAAAGCVKGKRERVLWGFGGNFTAPLQMSETQSDFKDAFRWVSFLLNCDNEYFC